MIDPTLEEYCVPFCGAYVVLRLIKERHSGVVNLRSLRGIGRFSQLKQIACLKPN